MFIWVSAADGLRPAFLLQSPKVLERCEMPGIRSRRHAYICANTHFCARCIFMIRSHLLQNLLKYIRVLRAVLPSMFIQVATTGTAASVLSFSLQ